MQDLEFEISGQSFPEEEKIEEPSVDNDQEAIRFSGNILEALNDKVEDYNERNEPSEINVDQLREVYINGANIFCESHNWQEQFPEKTCGDWAMAKVNMFLRMKGGDNRRGKSERININKFVDIGASWCPIQEDFDQTREDIKKYGLNYNFKNAQELYLEKYTKIELDY